MVHHFRFDKPHIIIESLLSFDLHHTKNVQWLLYKHDTTFDNSGMKFRKVSKKPKLS